MRRLQLLAALFVTSCAGTPIVWDHPAFYYGPTVVPFEEITGKSTQPAAAAGLMQTIGIGQYPMLNQEWDVIDTGPVELGGYVPGGSPAGMLQLGWKVGTLNGLANVVIAMDAVDNLGNGVLQNSHGGSGVILGGSLDIQALVTYFGDLGTQVASKMRAKLHDTNGASLPRGGL
jgi:hypothetical protein